MMMSKDKSHSSFFVSSTTTLHNVVFKAQDLIVQFITNPKSNLCRSLTIWNKTVHRTDSHAQDTSALRYPSLLLVSF
jgi:hypothetical protein